MMLRQWRGQTLASTVRALTPILRGRLQCFSPVEAKGVFEELDGLPTRLKRPMQPGLDPERASRSAYSGRGPWWTAGASHMNDADRAAVFAQLGLPASNCAITSIVADEPLSMGRTYGGVGGGCREASSSAISKS